MSGSYYVDAAYAADTPAVLDRPDLGCREPDVDPEIFYPGRGGSPAAAVAICQACPVTDECREWALTSGQRFGVWGATTDDDRRRIMRERYGERPRAPIGRGLKLTAAQAARIRELRAAGVPAPELAAQFDVSTSLVRAIAAGRHWPAGHPTLDRRTA
jgi:hypothetical protein